MFRCDSKLHKFILVTENTFQINQNKRVNNADVDWSFVFPSSCVLKMRRKVCLGTIFQKLKAEIWIVLVLKIWTTENVTELDEYKLQWKYL